MKIYHLHLPRTSGVFVRNQLNLPNSIIGHRSIINPDDFKTVDYAFGHYGSYPIRYADYSFCILRHPVERTISYFKYIKQHYYPGFDVLELIDFYVSDFKLYNMVDNLSNKFLTGVVDFDLYNRDIRYPRMLVENGWHLSGYCTDAKSAILQIESSGIDVLYYGKDLYDKISDIYKVKITNSQGFRVNGSIDYKIPDYYYNVIESLNKIDMEIYEHFKK